MTANSSTRIRKENIPQVLKDLDQWCTWVAIKRDGKKATKKPLQQEGNLLSFEEAWGWYEKGKVTGIGFRFTEADDFFGIDIDDMRTPQAQALMADARELGLYIELSPSLDEGKQHIIGRGRLEGKGIGSDVIPGVELYDRGRFFTVTGIGARGDASLPGQLLVNTCERWRNEYRGVSLSQRYSSARRETVEACIDRFERLGRANIEMGGMVAVTCPWYDEHTPDSRTPDEDTSTVLIYAAKDGHTGFKCHHSHCSHRSLDHVITWLAEQGVPIGCEEEDFPAEDEIEEPETVWGLKAAPMPEVVEFPEYSDGERKTGGGGALARMVRAPVPLVELADEAQAPRWQVADSIQVGQLVLLLGHRAVGKSFLALHLAQCVASGAPFFGQEIVRPGRVAYVTGEWPSSMLGRARAIGRRYAEEQAKAGEGKDHDARAIPLSPDVDFFAWSKPLTEVENRAELYYALEGKGYVMVILDTWAKFMAVDQLDATANTALIHAVEVQLARRLDATFVWPTHVPKMQKETTDPFVLTARGSGSIEDSTHVILAAVQDGGSKTLALTRCKDRAPRELGRYDIGSIDVWDGDTAGYLHEMDEMESTQANEEHDAELAEVAAGALEDAQWRVIEALQAYREHNVSPRGVEADSEDGWFKPRTVWKLVGEPNTPADIPRGSAGRSPEKWMHRLYLEFMDCIEEHPKAKDGGRKYFVGYRYTKS